MGSLSVSNFMNSFTLNKSGGLVVTPPVQYCRPMVFFSCNNFVHLEGTYTPNNDYLFLQQNIPPSLSPNFLCLWVSGIVNLTITAAQGDILNAAPICQTYMHVMPQENTYIPNGIYFEGRVGVPSPMPQGVSVDYLAIFGQVTF